MRGLVAMGVGSILALSGCATTPEGPDVMALPPPGKDFAVFQQDDMTCRDFAAQRTQSPGSAESDSALTSTGIGAAVGTGIGALIGSLGGGFGTGAVIGGAAGLLGGGAIGASAAESSGATAQQRYDIAYTQCMYARGNSVQSPPSGYGYAPEW